MITWVARTYDRRHTNDVLDNLEISSCVAVFISYFYNGVKYAADETSYVLSLAALVDVYTSVPPFARVTSIWPSFVRWQTERLIVLPVGNGDC